MKVYVIAYCQNSYQEDRIRNFVGGCGNVILNQGFAEREGTSLIPIVEEGWEGFMQEAEGVWVFNISYPIHLEQEKRGIDSGLDITYFKMSHSGESVGRAYEAERVKVKREGLIEK